MNQTQLKERWKQEEQKAFSGWDFSRLRERYVTDPLPWDYREKARDFLRPNVRLLDMGTGGGEFLLSLGPPYRLTAVTEGWRPNYELCLQRLAPLGIQVKKCACGTGERMPFEDDSFDLILNRQSSYDIHEVRRVLKPNGFFLTQQVGSENGLTLAKRLIPNVSRSRMDFNLENELPKFQKTGFRVTYGDQAYPIGRFYDVGAICFHAKIIEWEFPGFSVDGCFDRLLRLQEEIEARGFVENQEHRFLLIAKNTKGENC